MIGLMSPAAQAQELRYSSTTPGGIAATGNTLGLAKATGTNGPGTNGSIGTFITTDTTSVDDDPDNTANPWPAGTTNDWTANGSSAALDLPAGAEVLYAELVWAGSFAYGTEDVSASLDSDVTLSANAADTAVTPDGTTAQTFSEDGAFAVRYYIRSADVTAFVSTHGAASYTVSGVPATQDTGTNTLNAAGWTLVVAYRNPSELIRNVSIFVGGSFVDENTEQDYSADGFCAPPFGPVEGRVILSAMEGDADLSGDQLSIAPTDQDTFVLLSGPNNPETNILASQINDRDGVLDTSGTFGTFNHDAFGAENVTGGRQGWDLTAIPLSAGEGTLANDQTSAVMLFDTTGDSFVPALLAFEIDVKAPDFTQSSTTVTPQQVDVGDTLTVTATLRNTGAAPAADLQFQMALDSNLELTAYTTDGTPGDADGTTVTASSLLTGVPAGSLAVDTTRTIEMEVTILDAPASGNTFTFAPQWEHNFVTCDGEPSLDEIHAPSPASVTFLVPQDTGDTGDTGMPPLDDTGGLGEAGCKCGGCNVSGMAAVPWWGGLALLGVFVRRRRTA